MGPTSSKLLLWGPRILGIGLVLFFALFAADALDEGSGPGAKALALGLHLVPALLVLAVVAVAWRWPRVGGVALVALGLLYAAANLEHPSWVLGISGPLLLIGLLFLWSWRHHGPLRHAG